MASFAEYTETDLSPQHRAVWKLVEERKKLSEKGRQHLVPRWREYHGLYRSHREQTRAFAFAGTESDRDDVISSARREFGAELFIPIVFTIIETATPRALMNDPRMKVKPKHPNLPRARADAVRELFEQRQSEIGYSLRLVPTAKSGFKYGLGVQKTMYEKKTRKRVNIEPGIYGQRVRNESTDVLSEGPVAENVPLEDFFWDPLAKNIETSRYAIHRTWRDFTYVRERIERGEWGVSEDGQSFGLDLERIKGMGGPGGDYTQALSERARAAGYDDVETNLGKLHEVWEYHDGERVYTILDQILVVQDAETPFTHRELPFQIFRPIPQEEESEFCGIGLIEPTVHLQYELNTLRSQRRDNATMVLQKAFMYAEGLVDPADLVIGPGKGIPVFGNPNDVIKTLDFGDIPASGYQEERAIKDDIDFVSAVNDTVAGSQSEDTATGTQLVMAAANARIQMMTKLLGWETIKPAASQWLEIFRAMMGREPKQVAVPGAAGYEFVTVDATDLDAVDEVLPEYESTAPENTAQKRSDAAVAWNQMNGNPVIDQRKALLWYLRQNDIPDAENFFTPEQTQLDPMIAQVVGETIKASLIQNGLDEEQAEDVGEEVMRAVMSQTGVTPPPESVAQANGASEPAAVR